MLSSKEIMDELFEKEEPGESEEPYDPLKLLKGSVPEPGMVSLDSPFAQTIGFTSDRFEALSYLWLDKHKATVYISVVQILESERGKGHFARMVRRLLKMGYMVKVPTPFPKMEAILNKWQFKRMYEVNQYGDRVEVYYKMPAMD